MMVAWAGGGLDLGHNGKEESARCHGRIGCGV